MNKEEAKKTWAKTWAFWDNNLDAEYDLIEPHICECGGSGYVQQVGRTPQICPSCHGAYRMEKSSSTMTEPIGVATPIPSINLDSTAFSYEKPSSMKETEEKGALEK
jgi:hypothetical protein